jgi:membrane protein YqaA with SNARE-associated domain
MIIQYKLSAKRLGLINRYYKITKFYSFLKDTAFKGGIIIVFFVLLLLGVQYFIMDINELLINMVAMFSPILTFSLFLISESVLGLIPPEVFIGWAAKSQTPWLFLFILATMSYFGGSVAYFIGNRLLLIPAVNRHIETKIAKHIYENGEAYLFLLGQCCQFPIQLSVWLAG